MARLSLVRVSVWLVRWSTHISAAHLSSPFPSNFVFSTSVPWQGTSSKKKKNKGEKDPTEHWWSSFPRHFIFYSAAEYLHTGILFLRLSHRCFPASWEKMSGGIFVSEEKLWFATHLAPSVSLRVWERETLREALPRRVEKRKHIENN